MFFLKIYQILNLSLYNNLNDVLLPVVWFEDHTYPNNETKEKLTKLYQLIQFIQIFPLALLIVGVFLVVVFICLFFAFIFFNFFSNRIF
jgi:hypothetical protein